MHLEQFRQPRRSFGLTPDLGDLGQSYEFAVEVSDGRGGTDQLAWQVSVPNRAPEITSI